MREEVSRPLLDEYCPHTRGYLALVRAKFSCRPGQIDEEVLQHPEQIVARCGQHSEQVADVLARLSPANEDANQREDVRP